MKIITKNKKAFFDYDILSRFEAGVVLKGDEVKSIRKGEINLTGAFITVHENELFMINAFIASYSHAFQKNEEQTRRSRKLLVHKRELHRLIGDIARKGITLIPLALYFNDKRLVKLDVGICKHKKSHQKKEEMRERDIKRETARELKNY